MKAFAVIPCTLSPELVVSTVTPVANIPSVRRKAIAGSPSRPLPSSSASEDGATSKEAPNASGADMALASAISNSSGFEPSTSADSDDMERGGTAAPLAQLDPRLALDRAHLLL